MKTFTLFLVLFSALVVYPPVSKASEKNCNSVCQNELEETQAKLSELIATEQDLKGVEVLIASGLQGNLESHWGHTFLRFVSKNGDWNSDFIVEFVAETAGEKVSIRKGLFGGYAASAQIESFGDKWAEYVSSEDRTISRVILPTTLQSRGALIDTLSEWLSNPETFFKNYTFVDNNCAGLLTRFLKSTGFPSNGTLAHNPEHIPGYLTRILMSPYPELVIQSPLALFKKVAQLLNITLQEAQKAKNWPSSAEQTLEAGLTDLEIKGLLQFVSDMPPELGKDLRSRHSFGNGGATLDEALGIQAVPDAMYAPCADQACIEQIIQDEHDLWTEEQLADERKLRAEAAEPVLTDLPPSISEARFGSEEAENFKLLMEWDTQN